MKTPLERIRIGACVLASVFLIGVFGFRFWGGYDWIDAVWMVVITISTVGFGERSEHPPAVQLLTIFVIILGMSASAYTFGGLIQMLLEGELERILGKRRMNRELDQLSGHVIVCGYGRIGQNLTDELRPHRQVVIVEQEMSIVEELRAQGLLAVAGDATDEELLQKLHVERAQSLVTCLPSDANNVFITLTARELNPKIQIIARAEHRSTEKKLRQAGADKVVMPAIVGARHMLRLLTRPSTADLMELVAESSFTDLELDEVLIEATGKLVGITVQETEAHATHQLLVIAVKRADDTLVFNPKANHRFEANDTVMIMGRSDDIVAFRRQFEV